MWEREEEKLGRPSWTSSWRGPYLRSQPGSKLDVRWSRAVLFSATPTSLPPSTLFPILVPLSLSLSLLRLNYTPRCWHTPYLYTSWIHIYIYVQAVSFRSRAHEYRIIIRHSFLALVSLSLPLTSLIIRLIIFALRPCCFWSVGQFYALFHFVISVFLTVDSRFVLGVKDFYLIFSHFKSRNEIVHTIKTTNSIYMAHRHYLLSYKVKPIVNKPIKVIHNDSLPRSLISKRKKTI